MGVSKESISKFLIGNRFHVKLRILSPYSNRIFIPFYLNLLHSEFTPFRWQSTDSSKAYRNTSGFECDRISYCSVFSWGVRNFY